VTAASVPERVGGQQVLQKVHQIGDAVSRLYLIWVDGGYSGNPFLQWAMDMFGRVIQVVLRPRANAPKFAPRIFVVYSTSPDPMPRLVFLNKGQIIANTLKSISSQSAQNYCNYFQQTGDFSTLLTRCVCPALTSRQLMQPFLG